MATDVHQGLDSEGIQTAIKSLLQRDTVLFAANAYPETWIGACSSRAGSGRGAPEAR
jgi:hypothetical protein